MAANCANMPPHHLLINAAISNTKAAVAKLANYCCAKQPDNRDVNLFHCETFERSIESEMKSVIGWTANWRHATNTNLLLIASHSSFVCEKPTMENQLRKIIFCYWPLLQKWNFYFWCDEYLREVMWILWCHWTSMWWARASCHIIKYISFEFSRWFGVQIPF